MTLKNATSNPLDLSNIIKVYFLFHQLHRNDKSVGPYKERGGGFTEGIPCVHQKRSDGYRKSGLSETVPALKLGMKQHLGRKTCACRIKSFI